MARFGLPYVMLLLLTGCGPQNNPQLAPVLGANVLKPDEKSKKTVTVELPGAGTALPYPFPGTSAPGLDRAFAGPGPSQSVEFRLSMPADAAFLIIGDAAVGSGAAIVHTQAGSIEVLPDGRIHVVDAKGHVKASGRQACNGT